MKRHDSLLLVAREHHDSLVMARRLVTGKGSKGSGWPAEPAAQAQALLEFYRVNLERHFAAENKFVFQAALECDAAEVGAMIEKLMQEHEYMTRRIQEMAADPEVETADLVAFGQLLNDHVRMEDRQLFPAMEAELSVERLARMEAELEKHYS